MWDEGGGEGGMTKFDSFCCTTAPKERLLKQKVAPRSFVVQGGTRLVTSADAHGMTPQHAQRRAAPTPTDMIPAQSSPVATRNSNSMALGKV